ncbi:hypothetical protein MMH89_00320 [Candidatus Comchoanobacter bicostacola]|uniref:Uncharacterized protein n=1 Tax=Candidatus Comchoanobacter bicostacola TaxID=2919598 RepID=A0ABY5DLF1_9GAMM|nr:hypothetical protein [Candidatus Comchoanobacter bicostacola]UTC24610.1 hypothetical protein MMH89_00320 [Candidatus Comchoanobacter bicostacola]
MMNGIKNLLRKRKAKTFEFTAVNIPAPHTKNMPGIPIENLHATAEECKGQLKDLLPEGLTGLLLDIDYTLLTVHTDGYFNRVAESLLELPAIKEAIINSGITGDEINKFTDVDPGKRKTMLNALKQISSSDRKKLAKQFKARLKGKCSKEFKDIDLSFKQALQILLQDPEGSGISEDFGDKLHKNATCITQFKKFISPNMKTLVKSAVDQGTKCIAVSHTKGGTFMKYLFDDMGIEVTKDTANSKSMGVNKKTHLTAAISLLQGEGGDVLYIDDGKHPFTNAVTDFDMQLVVIKPGETVNQDRVAAVNGLADFAREYAKKPGLIAALKKTSVNVYETFHDNGHINHLMRMGLSSEGLSQLNVMLAQIADPEYLNRIQQSMTPDQKFIVQKYVEMAANGLEKVRADDSDFKATLAVRAKLYGAEHILTAINSKDMLGALKTVCRDFNYENTRSPEEKLASFVKNLGKIEDASLQEYNSAAPEDKYGKLAAIAELASLPFKNMSRAFGGEIWRTFNQAELVYCLKASGINTEQDVDTRLLSGVENDDTKKFVKTYIKGAVDFIKKELKEKTGKDKVKEHFLLEDKAAEARKQGRKS